MKYISVYDLQVIPELSKLSVFDLVHPDNDKVVYPFLEIMGFDTEYPIHYTVSQHRTMSNKVKIGYVLRGEVNINRQHLTGAWSTTIDKLVAADYQGGGLLNELLSLQNTSLDYSAFHSAKEADPTSLEQFPLCLTNPDEEIILAQIKQLENILLDIRGNPYAEDGNLKMPKDRGDNVPPYVQRKQRKEKAKQ